MNKNINLTEFIPIVSVVVPVHNTSQYLDECLESLTSQTLKEIEIICVNDASTDDSLEKLELWKDRDERIVVINSLENIKAGGARNLGIKAAKAEYIGFVDSDDYVSKEMFELLIDHSINHSADIVNSNLHIYHGTCDIPKYNIMDNKEELTKEKIIKNMTIQGMRIWTGIYKKSLFDRFQLYFPENIYYEDNAIATPLFLVAKTFVMVNNTTPTYYYRVTSATSYTQFSMMSIEKMDDRQTTAVMMLNHTKRIGIYESYHNEIDYIFYRLFLRNTLGGYLLEVSNPEVNYCRKVYNHYKRVTGTTNMRKNPYYQCYHSRLDNTFLLTGNLLTCHLMLCIIRLYKIIKK